MGRIITEDENLISAALFIKENCKKHDGQKCKECVFYGMYDGLCLFECYGLPHEWKIKKPCRWTENDYNLAKALKSIGVTAIFNRIESSGVVWCGNDGIFLKSQELPPTVFKALEKDKGINLDEIIKEYEECNEV